MGEDDADLIRAVEGFAETARDLLAANGLDATLQRVVVLAVELLESCEFAGISYVDGHSITAPASSAEVSTRLDALQAELGEGPCVDAIREHQAFRTGDLAAESRWRRFADRACDGTSVRSILAVRLYVEQDTFGALNLYASTGDAFSDLDLALAAVFATHAAVAIKAEHLGEDLLRMAHSRDLIGRAKGIIMAVNHVSDAEAFELLRTASQRLNVKVVAIADEVNYTGEPPA